VRCSRGIPKKLCQLMRDDDKMARLRSRRLYKGKVRQESIASLEEKETLADRNWSPIGARQYLDFAGDLPSATTTTSIPNLYVKKPL
jgi:hypothetical protein